MNTAAAWGKFAAEILSGNWDGAMEELTKVKDMINDRVHSPMTVPYLVILRSNRSTLSSNLVNPLVPVPLLQHRDRSGSTLRPLLFTSLHKLNSNFLTLDHSIPYCCSRYFPSSQTKRKSLSKTSSGTRTSY